MKAWPGKYPAPGALVNDKLQLILQMYLHVKKAFGRFCLAGIWTVKTIKIKKLIKVKR